MNVAAQRADPDSLLNTIRGMLAARKRFPGLAVGAVDWLPGAPKPVVAFTRGDGSFRLLALHNLSGEAQAVTIPEGTWRDVFDEARTESEAATLTAYGWRWLVEA